MIIGLQKDCTGLCYLLVPCLVSSPSVAVPISISRIAKGLQMGIRIVVYMFVLSMVHSLHKGMHRFLF